MSYNNILNPLTNKFVDVNTSEGLNVLKNYVSYVQNGGSKKSKDSKSKSKGSKKPKPNSKSKPAVKKAQAAAAEKAAEKAAKAAEEAAKAAAKAAEEAAKAAAVAKALEQERQDAIEEYKYRYPYAETHSDEDDMIYAYRDLDEGDVSDS